MDDRDLSMGLISAGNAITAFFFGIGSVVMVFVLKRLKELMDDKRKIKLLQIDLERRIVDDSINKLSDADILLRANQRNRDRDPSDDSSGRR